MEREIGALVNQQKISLAGSWPPFRRSIHNGSHPRWFRERFDSCRGAALCFGTAMSLTLRFIPPCLPIKAPQPPSGNIWLHEIKLDGFRVIARINARLVLR